MDELRGSAENNHDLRVFLVGVLGALLLFKVLSGTPMRNMTRQGDLIVYRNNEHNYVCSTVCSVVGLFSNIDIIYEYYLYKLEKWA